MPDAASSETVTLMPRVATAIKWTRLISVLAVLSSLIGSLVMFGIGTVNTFKVILLVAGAEEAMLETRVMF